MRPEALQAAPNSVSSPLKRGTPFAIVLQAKKTEVPAFAGMTRWVGHDPNLAHVSESWDDIE
ncbi:hypothetical protein VW23_003375 [Devosia insulae DS-56]|uniref:Uncharacterized protein n=1 Tax=Devosia insulae DS-56 TaxID=1116389 RepID=A0A1E5XJG7_9HYPH|nr:hypothetical protein VW23_003375 [Devosia insulae DS-56]